MVSVGGCTSGDIGTSNVIDGTMAELRLPPPCQPGCDSGCRRLLFVGHQPMTLLERCDARARRTSSPASRARGTVSWSSGPLAQ